MKKVNKFLSLVLAVIIAVSVFNVQDSTLQVYAVGVNELEPISLPCNSNGFMDLHTTEYTTYYSIDLPEDGDIKVTITSNDVQVFIYVKNRQYDMYKENVYTNSPFVAHFVGAAGRYYVKIHGKDADFRIKTEYKGYGFKETYTDSFENPKPYTLSTEANDVIAGTDSVDWYKIQIDETTRYRLDWTNYSGSAYMNFYNSDLDDVFYELNLGSNYGVPDYKLVYLTPGTYYIKVTGNYSKYKFNLYRYNFSTSKIKKVKSPKKKTAQIQFEYISGVDGYQIMYSESKNFKKKAKTKNYSKTYSFYDTLYANIGKLKRHKVYYFRIRTYYDRYKVRYYSDWSTVKKVKIK